MSKKSKMVMMMVMVIRIKMRWMKKKRQKVVAIYFCVIFWSILWVQHTGFFHMRCKCFTRAIIQILKMIQCDYSENACDINENDGKHNDVMTQNSIKDCDNT